MPQFAGGTTQWYEFLKKNINASRVAEAQDSTSFALYGERQRVLLKFVVCSDGSLCDFSCVNKDKVSPEAVHEALRVMKKSPNWTPGKVNGMPVRTYFTQPILFVFE